MQPALTGGAVNLSGGIISTERDRIVDIDTIFSLTILSVNQARAQHSGLNSFTVKASAHSVRANIFGHYLSAK